MPTEYTPLQSLAGGALIGIAAVMLMAFNGRIAGVTGILSGLLPPAIGRDWAWRAAFIVGMLAAPLLYWAVAGAAIEVQSAAPAWLLAVSGVVVGVGVSYGSGCTSGHGICGLARFSPRSLAATLVFMATTAATVFVVRHAIGG